MAIIITIIVTIIIILTLAFKVTPKNYTACSKQKVLVFSHKSDIDRYGLCYFTKACI